MRKIVFLLGCCALALVACGQAEPAAAPTSAAAAPTAAPTSAPTAEPPTSAPTAAPTAEPPTSAPTAAPAPTEAQVAATPAVSPKPGQGGGTSIAPPADLVDAAQRQLALHLKVRPADLPLQSANAKQWPDGALGCPQDGQAYPQIVTPGFVLIFTDAAQSVQYPVHTGRSAAQMLLCQNNKPIDMSVAPAARGAPDTRMGGLARVALAHDLSLAEADVTVVAVEETQWRDSSLGCPKPGMNYLQVITPGYKITLEAQGKRYEYHSDNNRRVVRCDKP